MTLYKKPYHIHGTSTHRFPNPPPPNQISCTGATLSVAPNLLSALCYLRDPTHEQVFWIDAICIDQGINAERSEQVQRMHQIFSQAEEVVVWLGEEVPMDGLAIETMDRLYLYFENCGDAADHVRNLWDSERSGVPGGNDPGWHALASLIRRRWFYRVWVIQEVVMASAVRVMLGTSSLDWERMVKLFFSPDSSYLVQLFGEDAKHSAS